MQIFKTFNGKSEADLKESSFRTDVLWNNIMPAIEEAVMLRPDEIIDGLVISEDSISVRISRKRGRKISELFTPTTPAAD